MYKIGWKVLYVLHCVTFEVLAERWTLETFILVVYPEYIGKIRDEVFTKEVSRSMISTVVIIDKGPGWWDPLYRNKSFIGGVMI